MRGQLSRMALIAVILLLPSACAALPTAESPTQTPAAPLSQGEKLFRAYVNVFNEQDVDAALALFVDQDLSFRTADGTRVEKAAVRTLLEGGIGEGETLEVTNCVDKEGKTVCQALARKPPCLKAQCGLDVFHGKAADRAEGRHDPAVLDPTKLIRRSGRLRDELREVCSLGAGEPGRRLGEDRCWPWTEPPSVGLGQAQR